MKKFLLTIAASALLLCACAPAATATQLPADPTIIPPTNAPTQSAPNDQWISYRDSYYGYGIALPCWWVVNPTGEHGGAMSLRSYDDAFFAAHSTKGNWTDNIVPQGAVKLDFVVIENLDPAADTETLIRQNSPPEDEIVSTTPADFNGHAALLVEFKHTTSDPVTYVKAYFLRFGPDKLLLVAGYPHEGLQSADVQAVLHSLAFSDSESIAFPSTAPGPALDGMPESCK
jgi:hypothetical protein